MLSIPAVALVVPRSRNNGLSPSEDPLRMIRKCYLNVSTARSSQHKKEGARTDLGKIGNYEPYTQAEGQGSREPVVMLLRRRAVNQTLKQKVYVIIHTGLHVDIGGRTKRPGFYRGKRGRDSQLVDVVVLVTKAETRVTPAKGTGAYRALIGI